ncbi:MAG: ATP-binding protein, partial [Anaerolineae bacterium]|nr:ATP-binding protein [Anaerolineae bacterium]
MNNEPTFQDLLGDFSDEVFVGRTEQLDLFEKAITAARPLFLILAVHGQGGVGKSTLLEQFRHTAHNHNALTALTNEDYPSILTTLEQLAHDLEDAGHPCPTFKENYHHYQELKEQVDADPKAPTGMWDFALRSAAKISMKSLRRVPIGGEAAEVLLTPEAEEVVADQVSAMASYVAQKFKKKDDRTLLLDTTTELTRTFLVDLNGLAQHQRIILFFDTYEKTAPYLDDWLRGLLTGKYGQFSSRILFVIAGRYPLGQNWTRFQRATRQVELSPFTDAEVREYLAQAGITDDDQVDELIRLSERLPVLLALLTSVPGNLSGEVAEDAVERFLQGVTEDQRHAALAASVSRFFNEDILTVILGEEVAQPSFDWLSTAHFVRTAAGSWRYHDVVRNLMQRYLRMRSLKHCVDIHSQLVNYYKDRMIALNLPAERQVQNATWRQLYNEYIYHTLSQQPTEGLDEFFNQLLHHLRIPNEEFLDDAQMNIWLKDHYLILSQAHDESQNAQLTRWVEAMVVFVNLTDKDTYSSTEKQSVLQCFYLMSEYESIEPQAKVNVLLRCATLQYNSNPDQAIFDLTRAIELQPENGDNYYWRGLAHREAKDYPAALE